MRRYKNLSVAALVLLLVLNVVIVLTPCAHAQTELLSLHDIFKRPAIEGNRASNGSISPDCKWVVFTWNDIELNKGTALYKVPVTGGSPVELKRPFSGRVRWMPEKGSTLISVQSGAFQLLNVATGQTSDLTGDISAGSSFTFSPDNAKITYTNQDGLWIINRDGTGQKQLTVNRVSGIRWTEDCRRIFYVQDGDIWYIDVETRETTKVTDETGEDMRGGIGSFNLSPDAKFATFSRRQSSTPQRNIIVPNYLTKYVEPGRGRNSFPDDPYSETSFYLVNMDEKLTREVNLGENKEFRTRAQNWSPDGSMLHIIKLSADSHVMVQLILNPKTGETSIIDIETEENGWIDGPGFYSSWNKEGKTIIFTSERSGYNHLWRVAADGSGVEQLTLGNWELENVRLMPDNETIVYQSTEIDPSERHIYTFNLKTKEKIRITSTEGMNQLTAVSDDGKYVLYSHASLMRPADYFIAETQQNSPGIQLSNTIPQEFKDVDWIKPRFVVFNNHLDGTPLYAMQYDPPDLDRSRKYPAVIFVHGAGYTQNTIKGWATYSPNIKFHHRLVQKGYVVLDIDYRGSEGYGRDFRNDVYMYLGGKDLDDEVAGVEYLKTLDYVDTDYVGIYGGSYGGFMTLMAMFLRPDVFEAGAALRSVTDWESYNASYTQARLGRVSDNKEAYVKSSPIHHAENLKGHLLLLHGLRDSNVFAQDTIQLIERLIKAGKTDLFDAMLYPSQNHGFTDPDSWIDEYRRIEKWFDRYLMEPMGLTPVDDKK